MCSPGHVEVVRLLLEARANHDSDLTAGGVTPLLMSCVRGHVEVLRALLEHRSDVNKPCTDDGTTPLKLGQSAEARNLNPKSACFEFAPPKPEFLKSPLHDQLEIRLKSYSAGEGDFASMLYRVRGSCVWRQQRSPFCVESNARC